MISIVIGYSVFVAGTIGCVVYILLDERKQYEKEMMWKKEADKQVMNCFRKSTWDRP